MEEVKERKGEMGREQGNGKIAIMKDENGLKEEYFKKPWIEI